MKEKNYDFRRRHWEYHRPDRRNRRRRANENEVLLDETWSIGCAENAGEITRIAVADFQDYLAKSMGLTLPIVHRKGDKVLYVEVSPQVKASFVVQVGKKRITLAAAEDKLALRGTIYLEDVMNLAEAPILPRGRMVRKLMYEVRIVHSGTGLDDFPDAELLALLHAGYDGIEIFCEGIDRNHIGYCDFNDIIDRADRFGIKSFFHNYIRTYIHPDEPGAQAKFDAVYGELFRHYPKLAGIALVGESLEFPSRDPATTGKPYNQSVVDGIPDTRPSPGWYPCRDYPAYIQCIEKAVHKFKPDAKVLFSTYNWGYAPLALRKKFLRRFPRKVDISICYEIFSKRKLENLHTPVMDYTISAAAPGYYFTSECAAAHRLGIAITGNVNTTGIAWDFGCVPLVPAPEKLLARDLYLRQARKKWHVVRHYATHHYGWWNSVAADLGKWTMWENFEPDYDRLLTQIAIRDYGEKAAPHIRAAWRLWSEAMNHYVASNEDQYGPWRVGAAYPFIFHPNISRTMQGKEIAFPTQPGAHWGNAIIKTFYQPYENAEQSPGFLRYPAELRFLQKMLKLWNQGLAEAAAAIKCAPPQKRAEAKRLEALGHFIRNSIITVMHCKLWWRANIAMLNCPDAETAEKYLDEIDALAVAEIANARDTIPAVEYDSRLGWEPSMEYVCDKWHLKWKIRQVESARREISAYRRMLNLHRR